MDEAVEELKTCFGNSSSSSSKNCCSCCCCCCCCFCCHQQQQHPPRLRGSASCSRKSLQFPKKATARRQLLLMHWIEVGTKKTLIASWIQRWQKNHRLGIFRLHWPWSTCRHRDARARERETTSRAQPQSKQDDVSAQYSLEWERSCTLYSVIRSSSRSSGLEVEWVLGKGNVLLIVRPTSSPIPDYWQV